MKKKGTMMKIVIRQTQFCYEDEQIFKDYPILEKYKDKMDYYTGYDDGTNPNYYAEVDYSKYWDENAIVIDMDESEWLNLLEELMNVEELVIRLADEYEHNNYNVDRIVEIYDSYRE
jgi:hypothetical protein